MIRIKEALMSTLMDYEFVFIVQGKETYCEMILPYFNSFIFNELRMAKHIMIS